MIRLVFVSCLVMFFQNVHGNAIDKVLPLIMSDLGSDFVIEGFTYTWHERHLIVIKEDGKLSCSKGSGKTLNSLKSILSPTIDKTGKVFHFLYFDDLRYSFDQCVLKVLSTTGIEREYGMIGDHRLNLQASTEESGSECTVTVDGLSLEFLKSVMVNESESMQILQSFNQYDKVRAMMRNTIRKSIDAALAKVVGKKYTVPGPCRAD